MDAHTARQAHRAVNQFLFEASLLAGELESIRKIENPEQRTFVLRRGQEAYEELLANCAALHVSPEDAPVIQALLQRIRSRLTTSS